MAAVAAPVRSAGFLRRIRRWSLAGGLVLLSFLSIPAFADVWGYVDDQGVAHFAAEQVDARYELFYRGNGAFDSSEALAGGGRPGARGAAPRLLALFEASPAYPSVQQALREAAAAHRIDYELLQALIATESGFDAGAVSPKGAVGLMQVMPATAQRYGVARDARRTVAQQLTDPRTNIRAGARYLSDLMKLFPGRLELVLAAYNAGEGAVQRAGNRVPNYRETQNYVRTVMQLYAVLKPPAAVTAQRATRVRMALGGRANMMPPAGVDAIAALPVAQTEQD